MYSRQDIPSWKPSSGADVPRRGLCRVPCAVALALGIMLSGLPNMWCTGTARAADEAPVKIRLFGTLEFRGPLKSLPVWLDVLKRNEGHSIFTPESKLNASTTWADFKGKLEKMSPLEQLKAVNLFWNKWPYREDRDVYGKSDYWAIPEQFRKNSGDCEDYSIAKYFTLRELGVPLDSMRIVVLKETIRNIAHAVLVVYLDGDAYVLDNLSNNVLSHARYKNYDPQYSVNEKARWAHVRPRK